MDEHEQLETPTADDLTAARVRLIGGPAAPASPLPRSAFAVGTVGRCEGERQAARRTRPPQSRKG